MATEVLQEQLKRLRQSDEKAFETIYKLYVDKLYFFILKYVKSPDVAEELVQRVFVKLWDVRAKIDVDLSFDAFLFRVTKNLVLNYLKRGSFEDRFRDQLKSKLSSGITQTENEVIHNETARILERAISLLPARRQQIFRMSRLQGLDHSGIACKLGISRNTVKVQIVQATKFVRDYFTRYQMLAVTPG